MRLSSRRTTQLLHRTHVLSVLSLLWLLLLAHGVIVTGWWGGCKPTGAITESNTPVGANPEGLTASERELVDGAGLVDGVSDAVMPGEAESETQDTSRVAMVGVGAESVIVVDRALPPATLGENLAGTVGVGLVLRCDVHK